VKDGSIPIVITTPESGVGSLRSALHIAAESGSLRYFIVDEAHLIRVWGVDFRPEFLLLSALRRELVRAAPAQDQAVRTVLLSATFTPLDLQGLTEQFSDEGGIDLVGANGLRPEPDYWAVHASDEETRVRLVLDAVAHLPRPIFLYTSWVDDAEEWVDRLGAAGYRRVARVTGKVPGAERAEVLVGLRGDDTPTSIDIVVATSAFGLGISFDDVRTVIHACLPESIDRFYQEVGRAGRDRSASVALCVWTDEDRDKANPLARTIVIGAEKARNRWKAMTQSPLLGAGQPLVNVDGPTQFVDLSAVPTHRDRPGDLNEAWNRATLALMARAGFIRYETHQPLTDEGSADSNRIDVMLVTVQVGNLANGTVWEEAWARLKTEIHGDAAARRLLVDRLVLPGTRVCEVLASAFAVGADVLPFDQSPLWPVMSCGQCVACRFSGERGGRLREPAPISATLVRQKHVAAHHLLQGVVPVLVPTPSNSHERMDVVRSFSDLMRRIGVRVIVLDLQSNDRQTVVSTFGPLAGSVFLADAFAETPSTLPPLPMGVIGPLAGEPIRPCWLLDGAQPFSLVLMSETTPSIRRHDRSMSEMPPPKTVSMKELLGYL